MALNSIEINRKLAQAFFECNGDGSFKCLICSGNVKQLKTGGICNLVKHLGTKKGDHEEKVTQFKLSLKGGENILQKHFGGPSEKLKSTFAWIEWMVEENLPFSFVDSESYRANTKLEPISRKTLTKYTQVLVQAVAQKMREDLPEKFGIVFDGWTDRTHTHFVGIFAVYCDNDGAPQYPLLAFQPLLDETDLSAESYEELILSTLEYYGRKASSVLFLVGDNCSVNRRLANITNIPLVGCASHRLKCAVDLWLEPHAHLFAKLSALMAHLTTLKNCARLRTCGKPQAKRIVPTRWSSKFDVSKRYFEISDALTSVTFQDDEDLDKFLLTKTEHKLLKSLLDKMGLIHEVTIALQTADLNLDDVRHLFDRVLRAAEDSNDEDALAAFKRYLMPDADIVQNSAFEDAVVKICANRANTLDEDERKLMEPFLQEREPDYDAVDATLGGGTEADDVASVLRAAKRRRFSAHGYGDLSYIPPTSNLVERFFSQTKLIQTDHRCSLLPANFEALAYLKVNRAWWSRALLVVANAGLPAEERL